MKQWTQDQAVAFECAREVITNLMAIYSGRISHESAKALPDTNLIAELRANRSELANERVALHVGDDSDVARIRKEYGAAVRAWRGSNSKVIYAGPYV